MRRPPRSVCDAIMTLPLSLAHLTHSATHARTHPPTSLQDDDLSFLKRVRRAALFPFLLPCHSRAFPASPSLTLPFETMCLSLIQVAPSAGGCQGDGSQGAVRSASIRHTAASSRVPQGDAHYPSACAQAHSEWHQCFERQPSPRRLKRIMISWLVRFRQGTLTRFAGFLAAGS